MDNHESIQAWKTLFVAYWTRYFSCEQGEDHNEKFLIEIKTY